MVQSFSLYYTNCLPVFQPFYCLCRFFSKMLSAITHCRVENVKCLSGTSMVLLEQIKTIDKRRVKKYMGRLDKEQMRRVDDCIEISLGLQIPEDIEAP